MKIFCTVEFEKIFKRLAKKNAYRDLEKEIIDYFFAEHIDLAGGKRIGGHPENPYIKKRLSGSGGYRTYFYIIVKEDNLYLMFLHPKTGPDGSPNITDNAKTELLKNLISDLKTGRVLSVRMDENKQKLVFKNMK
ncbi:hypothetical protein [Dyadobacter luticola]|uniref:Addiction module toxin RelE n=1 Tax=Dyadobacter luticola TaxID=1979387 RepID=A0A5R9L4Z0_9BACT|nr:hypothetical protein [Dyadobacter luticola]TLV03427.1 hypothetical protein FEN17_07420 [Dyadobacter luticola]